MSFCRRAAYSALSKRSDPVVADGPAAADDLAFAGSAENRRISRTGRTVRDRRDVWICIADLQTRGFQFIQNVRFGKGMIFFPVGRINPGVPFFVWEVEN
jgi:hypothetical protein